MNLSIQRKACEKFKQSLMEEGRKTVYAKCLCAKLDAYNRQISQTQKREEVWERLRKKLLWFSPCNVRKLCRLNFL